MFHLRHQTTWLALGKDHGFGYNRYVSYLQKVQISKKQQRHSTSDFTNPGFLDKSFCVQPINLPQTHPHTYFFLYTTEGHTRGVSGASWLEAKSH